MDIFSKKRMYNIFRKDQKSLIVAIDHGSAMKVFPDLIETREVLEKIEANGADAFLTTFGIAKNFWKTLKNSGLILRIDGGVTLFPSDSKQYSQLFTIEDALRLGADAVACMGLPGTENESNTLKYLSRICADADKWNIPVLAEMLPGGFNKELHTPDNIAVAARIGVELGADIIKTEFPGDLKEFNEAIKGIYKPIVVLGGSKTGDYKRLFTMVKESLDVGAKGVAIGRNIWGHPNPDKITAALSSLIHDDYTVEQALELL